MKSEQLTGLAVSPGVGIGKAYLFCPFQPVRTEHPALSSEDELTRLTFAFRQAEHELETRIFSLPEGSAEADIMAAHLEILRDPCMSEGIQTRINGGMCCEAAVWDTYEEMITLFRDMEDELFRSRAADMADVRRRLLRCCAGKAEDDLSNISEPVILVAEELTPSDTVSLPHDHIIAIVTERGTAASHAAILARSCGIPAVLGVSGLINALTPGALLAVDANEGIVLVHPSSEQQAEFKAKVEEDRLNREANRRYAAQSVCTTDGVQITTEINVGAFSDLQAEETAWADGVGLFRTEFLYMESDILPDEEIQYQAYTQVLQAFGDRPVILRTLDIGGDKTLPYLDLPKEDNPFLGVRALRLCFAHPELFRIQLRAAYRASVHGRLWLMFPMVSALDDFRRAKDFCRQVQSELEREGIPFRRDVPLGIMIETPAIAIMADAAAQETDFASIGTNDLCQYICAADRMNNDAAEYYLPENPALLRMISGAAKAYATVNKPLGVCGELAADPVIAPLLVGLGIRSLSVSAASLGALRRNLSSRSMADMEKLAEQSLHCISADQVQVLLRSSK